MDEQLKVLFDKSGFKIAGWVITGAIVTVSVIYLYRQYIEFKKLRIDYQTSQYWLYKMQIDYPGFEPKKS